MNLATGAAVKSVLGGTITADIERAHRFRGFTEFPAVGGAFTDSNRSWRNSELNDFRRSESGSALVLACRKK